MRLVEEATEQYQQVTLLQSGGGARETFSTTHNPQTSDSDNRSIGDGVEEDESSVPDPGNGNVTSVTGTQVMDTPWKIFFQQSPHDITGSRSEREEHDKNDEWRTNPSSGGNVNHLSNEKDSDATTVNHSTNHISRDNITSSNVSVSVNTEEATFHWNVNVTEFKPSFV